ncbi:LexA family transcriptional regulator [Serratia fonticola]|uniref:LexA family transcriptional regulator n=2 Tax=Serratia fonticola TaxID=47917 RepID=A0ABY9PKX4_SERFO|nr:LexA family transcriptional regulator [Serratia fonticola]WMT13378.1 LexA family transcriptional regulator [Serratia fonticola]
MYSFMTRQKILMVFREMDTICDNREMKKWYELAKARMRPLGLTRDDISDRLEVTPGAVGHWLTGRRTPNLDQIATIMGMVGFEKFTVHANGMVEDPNLPIVPPEQRVEPSYKYPLLTALKAGVLNGQPESLGKEASLMFIRSDKKASLASYWLEVKGPSMTAPVGVSPSFPDGILILVDPMERDNIKPGDFCAAEVSNSPEAIFRQIINEAGIDFLMALNPSFPMTDCKERGVTLLGKVVAAKWSDDRF